MIQNSVTGYYDVYSSIQGTFYKFDCRESAEEFEEYEAEAEEWFENPTAENFEQRWNYCEKYGMKLNLLINQ